MFTNRIQKTLGLFFLLLLSSVKPSLANNIEYDPRFEMLNNFSQLQSVISRELNINKFKYKILLNDLNEKTNRAQCGDAQWHIPAGTQMRGRVMAVAKCRINGETALFYQGLDIKVYATMAVTARPLKFNEVVDADSLRLEEREVTQLGGADPVNRPEDLLGLQTRRGLPLGLPVRRDMFEAQPAIRVGDSVKVIIVGEGFKLSTEAVALQAAQPGQQIRVKTAQGKILMGAVSAQQTVELKL